MRLAFLVCALVYADPGVSAQAQPPLIRITPTWVAENPGRLVIGGGTGMNGSNSYGVQFRLEAPAVFRISTELVSSPTRNDRRPADMSMYRTTIQSDSPSTVVHLRFYENRPYSHKPVFLISPLRNTAEPGAQPDWIEIKTYQLDMRDLDELAAAIGEAPQR
jgi:hypothetical protein